MKLFIVLSAILTTVLGQEQTQRPGLVPVPLTRQLLGNQILRNENSSEEWTGSRRSRYGSDESNGPTRGILNVLRSNNNDSSRDVMTNYPDAAPFWAKIKLRLESSPNLSEGVRRHLTAAAIEKLNTCKVYTGGRGKGCLGQATGQVMNLIGTVEDRERNPSGN